MAQKRIQKRGEAAQVFRQFAWNVAGTLVTSPPKPPVANGPKR